MQCSPQQQYEFFKSCADKKSKNLEDVVIQHKKQILNIQGLFRCINNQEDLQPLFTKVESRLISVDYDVHILDFFQNGLTIEEKEEYANDAENVFVEKSLDQLCDFIVNKVGDLIDLKTLIFRIYFDIGERNSNSISISLEDYVRIRETVSSIISLVEKNHLGHDQWKNLKVFKNIPVTSIRSKLYNFAQDYVEIEKVWLATYSNILIVFYQSYYSKKLEEYEKNVIELIQPSLNEQVTFIISPIQHISDFIALEHQMNFKQVALLYDKAKWHFWLLKWFRIYRATPMVNLTKIENLIKN